MLDFTSLYKLLLKKKDGAFISFKIGVMALRYFINDLDRILN